MAESQNQRQEYRCCISSENSAGKMKIGSRTYNVCVLNTSRTGFCVRIPNSVAKQLRGNRRPILLFSGETWEVEVKSRYSDESMFTNLGVTRKRDLTKITQPSGWGATLACSTNFQSDPTFLAVLVIAFLAAVICLPGIGDSLGTAPKVREVINSVLK